ncbi:MAG: hypothetical protein ACI9V8_001209 [Urechidicola sp.]
MLKVLGIEYDLSIEALLILLTRVAAYLDKVKILLEVGKAEGWSILKTMEFVDC